MQRIKIAEHCYADIVDNEILVYIDDLNIQPDLVETKPFSNENLNFLLKKWGEYKNIWESGYIIRQNKQCSDQLTSQFKDNHTKKNIMTDANDYRIDQLVDLTTRLSSLIESLQERVSLQNEVINNLNERLTSHLNRPETLI